MSDEPRLLVTDLETTGLDGRACGIVEIGAVWMLGAGEFVMKCRPHADAVIEARAMEVNGCDWHLDPTVAAEVEALEQFVEWVGAGPVILCGQNPRHDLWFLQEGAKRHGLELPFVHRTLDLHTLAVAYALACGRRVPAKGYYTDEIYELLGMEPEPKPHRALVGAQKEAEAFRMLLGLPEALEPVPYELLSAAVAPFMDIQL
ncbi:3'-5' exonuclease [Verrucomicrobium spinosum]|uniref:3'-5' exonuclease n=1 Tax=Verrucomicrobium spinosum TaxID=2736 RepID=UPI000174666F|nr:3'-5' exonuclease [Verrucomicrobium spinosum]